METSTTQLLSSPKRYQDFFKQRVPGYPFVVIIFVALVIWDFSLILPNIQQLQAFGWGAFIRYAAPRPLICFAVALTLLWVSRSVKNGALLTLLFALSYMFFDSCIPPALLFGTISPWSILLWDILLGICIFGSLVLAVQVAGLNPLVIIGFVTVGASIHAVAARTILGASNSLTWLSIGIRSLIAGIILGLGFYVGLRNLRKGFRGLPDDESAIYPVERINTKFFVASWGLGLFWGYPFLLAIWRKGIRTEEELAVVVLASLVLLSSGIVLCFLIYKMWEAIQDGKVRMSPGKAVGLLFVPIFNLFWIFQVFAGFASDYNAYADRHSKQVPRLDRRLFIAYAIIAVLACTVPFPGIVFVPIAALMGLFTVIRVCNAINALGLT